MSAFDLTCREREALAEAGELAIRIAALAGAHVEHDEQDGDAPRATAELARLLRDRRFADLPAVPDENPPLDMQQEADAIAGAADARKWRDCFDRANWFAGAVEFLLGTYQAVDKTGETRLIEAIPTPWAWLGFTNNTATTGRENDAS